MWRLRRASIRCHLTALVGLGIAVAALGCAPAAGRIALVASQRTVHEVAPAEAVVLTYLEALNTHDLATARAQLTPERAAAVARMADSPFDNWISITNIQITGSSRGIPGSDDPGMAEVGARFNLRQREEVSMTNGWHQWFVRLRHDARTDRWLIVDEGSGP